MTEKRLTDEEIEARLGVALNSIGYAERGETTVGDTALKAARQVLIALKLAMLKKMDEDD